jgi:hypothetical protein
MDSRTLASVNGIVLREVNQIPIVFSVAFDSESM